MEKIAELIPWDRKPTVYVNNASSREVTYREYLRYWFYKVYVYQVPYTTAMPVQYALENFVLPNVDDYTRLCVVNAVYVDDIVEKSSPCSAHAAYRAKSVLAMSLNYAAETGLIHNNPIPETKQVKRPKSTIQVLSKDELRVILRSLKERPYAELEFLLMIFCGLRKGEVYGLYPSDFNEEAKTVSIARQYTMRSIVLEDGKIHSRMAVSEPKTVNSRRTLEVPDIVFRAVRERIATDETNRKRFGARYVGSPFLCKSMLGEPHSSTFLNRVADNISRDKQLRHFTPHSLRHTYATMLIEKGESIGTISRILGHKSEDTTFDIYCSVMDGFDDIAQVVQAQMNPFASPEAANG